MFALRECSSATSSLKFQAVFMWSVFGAFPIFEHSIVALAHKSCFIGFGMGSAMSSLPLLVSEMMVRARLFELRRGAAELHPASNCRSQSCLFNRISDLAVHIVG